jgi:hypothetical protein
MIDRPLGILERIVRIVPYLTNRKVEAGHILFRNQGRDCGSPARIDLRAIEFVPRWMIAGFVRSNSRRRAEI